MNDIARRSIPELLARYDLEPGLDDVFVEGSFDREIFESSLASRATRRPIYEIDTVDVPVDLLAKHGLTTGNKQRVIALARELLAVTADCRYLCLVDKDLDHWFGPLEDTRRLRWSTFCSIEMHFFTESSLNDILKMAGRAKIQRLADFTESMRKVLRDLFAIRLCDRELSLGLRWIQLRRYLTREGERIAFDSKKFVGALLNSNRCASRRKEFEAVYAKWLGRLSGDCRNHARGHDFVTLLAWTIGEFRGQRELSSEAAVERLLVLLARNVASIPNELV